MNERHVNPKPFSDEQLEQAGRMAARLGEQVKASADAMAEALRPAIERSVEGMRAIVEATKRGGHE